MGRMVLICEGDAHTVEYFHANGVYPSSIVFEATRFREMAPYLTPEDDVLVLIKGLTDFTLAEVYVLLHDLEENRDKLKAVTVMSNIDLGKISTHYYLYTGDLFYGEVKEVRNGRLHEVEISDDDEETLNDKSKKSSKRGKSSRNKSKTTENISINAVISRYKKYDKRDVKFTIYGKIERKVEPNFESETLANSIVIVDMFKSKEIEG